MSEISSSTLVNNYNLSTTFIVKSLVGLLLINSLFSGVDFSQIGLMKGLSSIADFGLKFILALVLLVLFRIRSFNLVKILFFAFMLLIGAALGAFYHG
ncbi:TPA: oligosaccharide repeat unit polymerase, partial [Escherichia coli]|nr:oligosaccharide repeat unit polymerase [Escherichia coli]